MDKTAVIKQAAIKTVATDKVASAVVVVVASLAPTAGPRDGV